MKASIEDITEKRIREFYRGIIKIDEPLRNYTTMRIGGTVKFFLVPVDCADLSSLLKFLNAGSIPVYIIGNGSNLLVSDLNLPVACVQLSSEYFKRKSRQENIIFAAAGVSLASLVQFSKEQELSGLEFLAGIPGSVGGALAMNAGVKTLDELYQAKELCSISDSLVKVEVIDRDGNIFLCSKDELEFGYRYSNLKDKIILGAWFELFPQKEEKIKNRIDSFLAHKQNTQELLSACAGCVFKNPNKETLSAGELIDRCNLKGISIGDAQISTVHANFIVNKGNAKFKQVKALMEMMQKKVQDNFGVLLEVEIEIWDV